MIRAGLLIVLLIPLCGCAGPALYAGVSLAVTIADKIAGISDAALNIAQTLGTPRLAVGPACPVGAAVLRLPEGLK